MCQPANPLRRLLILVVGFDLHSEQGLDALVQVERFTGPAGQDPAGVGMIEPVNRRESFGVSVGVRGESFGEGVGGPPRIGWGAVGHHEPPPARPQHAGLVAAFDPQPTLVHGGVVEPAEQHQVRGSRVAAPNRVTVQADPVRVRSAPRDLDRPKEATRCPT